MNKKRLLLPLLVLAVCLLATHAHPAEAGDLVISNTTTLENQVLVVDGSLVVQPGGKLVLNNATIVINETSDFQYNVTVRGELDLSNGSKINTTNGYKYTLDVDDGTLKIDRSTLENIGGYYRPGIKAYGSAPSLEFNGATIIYKGSGMNILIYISTTIDSDESTLGKLMVNGIETSSIDGYAPQNHMIDISGETIFNISNADFLDNKLTGSGDIYVRYTSNIKLPANTLIVLRNLKTDYIDIYTYVQTKLYIQVYNVTSGALKISSGGIYLPFNVNITNSTFAGVASASYSVSIIKVSSLYIKDVETQSIYIEDTNATIRDTVISNPGKHGIEIRETYFTPFSVNLTNIRVINVTSGYYYGDYSGVKIGSANEYTVIRIQNLTVTRKPGKENVPGICIGYAGGASIYVSDSVIPGIEIYKGHYGVYYYLKVSEAANLFISNVNSSLDGRRIIVVRDTDGASVSGDYAQVFIYNSSNIEVSNLSFDTNIPNPLVIASSANVSISNVNTSNKVFHSAILVGESANVIMDHLNVNSSTTAGITRSIEVINTDNAVIKDSRIMGGSTTNYATTILVTMSNLVIQDSLVLSEKTSGIAVGEIKLSNLEIVRSNITGTYKGVFAIGYIDISPPNSLAIYYSNITAGYIAVDYDNRLIIQSSNLTVKTNNPSDYMTVLTTSYPRYMFVNASKLEVITGNGFIGYIGRILSPVGNITILNSSFIGPAIYGVYVSQFTNSTGRSLLIKDNLFHGQAMSIYLQGSIGVSVIGNEIYSVEPGFPGGIVIGPGNIDQTIHRILYNKIDGKPILYLYNATETGLKGFGQVIAVMSTVEAEDTSITGYPGAVQLYSSTMTMRNASIVSQYSVKLTYYTDEQNLAVFKTQYGSTLRIMNSTLESNTTLILFEIDLGGGTGEGLVLNYTKINGTAYRLIDTSAPVSIGIYNSEIDWNATNEGSLYHEIVRMHCTSLSSGLEFDLVNTTVTITSSWKFDIENVKRVYWRNVTIRARGSSVSYYSTFLYNVKSARIDGVEFIGVSGIDADSSYVYITSGGVYNLSTGYTGLLYVEGSYSNAAFIENVGFRNVSGEMIHAGSSKAELGIINVDINSSVDNNNTNKYFLYLGLGAVYVGNFTANHSLGTPIYIGGTSALYMHYSALTNNTGFGLKATGGTVNVTYTYWGDAGGPNFTSTADANDPEEIYNTTTVYYKPVLTGLPGESDTQAPSISIVSPSDGVVWKGLQRVNVSVSDDHGVMAVLIFIDEQPAGFLFEGQNTTVIDTSIFRDGNHTLYAVAYDYAGHKSVDSIHVKIENYYPSANITEPENQSLVSGHVSVTYYVYDDNLDEAKLYANDTFLTSTSRVGYTRFTLDTKKFSDGDLWLKLVAVDKDGLTATYKIVITIDNTPPSLEVTSPINKSYVQGHVFIKFSTGDKHPGRYMVYLNGSLLANDTRTGSIEIDLDTTSYSDGLYNLTVYSVDRLGNENVSTRFFTIDNTPPETEILAPSHGEVVSGTVDINVSASDNIGLKRVIIYINGTAVFNKTVDPDNPTDPTYTYSWDTTNYDDGPYNITVETIDLAGNTVTSKEIVNVNNASPVPESGILAIGVLGALLLAFLVARRVRVG